MCVLKNKGLPKRGDHAGPRVNTPGRPYTGLYHSHGVQHELTQFANWVPVCKPGLCGVQSTNWTFKTSSLQTASRSLQTEPVRKLRPTYTWALGALARSL